MSQDRFFLLLSEFLKADQIIKDKSELFMLAQDWTRFYEPDAMAAVFPNNVSELSKIVKLAKEFKIQMVPSGGRTGLSAGAVASQGELVINLSRMNQISEVDRLCRTIRVGAGAVHQAVQERASDANLCWPIDLASKGSCQIGGNLATNAGGLHVIKYGHARNWVQSLEVVLPDASIVELNGELVKNNTGFALKDLFVGSEGTLGFISAATLKLTPKIKTRSVFLLAVQSIDSCLAVVEKIFESGLTPLAVEFFSQDCLNTVVSEMHFKVPFKSESPFCLLVEVQESLEDVHLQKCTEELFASGMVKDGTLAQSESEARALWAYRENITESLSHLGLVYKNDLALPIRALKNFVDELLKMAPKWYQGSKVFLFGHIGDGNIHVNVVDQSSRNRERFLSDCEKINESLFALVQKYKGSIAAEHGIGLLKRKYLHFSRSPEELKWMRGIKSIVDPYNLMNPGKIFSP